MPDLRPSIPLSSGPTLFLAPSPIAWQGRHLLNEVLPAAASCASTLVTAADDAMATNTLRVNLFMTWALRGLTNEWAGVFCMTSTRGTSRQRPGGFINFAHGRWSPDVRSRRSGAYPSRSGYA